MIPKALPKMGPSLPDLLIAFSVFLFNLRSNHSIIKKAKNKNGNSFALSNKVSNNTSFN